MEQGYAEKEVYFNKWCPKCRHFKLPENEEPCEECLSNPSQIDSHKPLKFEKGVSDGRKKVPNEGQQGE